MTKRCFTASMTPSDSCQSTCCSSRLRSFAAVCDAAARVIAVSY